MELLLAVCSLMVIGVGIVNKAVVDKASMLINKCMDYRECDQFNVARPLKRPWVMQGDGDLWMKC